MKFGLIVHSTENLGDDVQSLAAAQFLPRVDLLIDRDYFDKISGYVCQSDRVKVIMNGWFAHRLKGWPPPSFIDPLFISFHITPSIVRKLLRPRIVEYLKRYEVGCRDLWTCKILQKYGIRTYFSGCLTLTLDYRYSFSGSRKNVLIVDLDEEAYKVLPHSLIRRAEILTHHISRSITDSIVMTPIIEIMRNLFPKEIRSELFGVIYKLEHPKFRRVSVMKRFAKSLAHLRKFARAKVLITSRLHAALPAAAFGTPVVFVCKNPKDPRYWGLLRFINWYSVEEFKEAAKRINWDSPPLNPLRDELQHLKKELIRRVEEFVRESP